MHHAQDSRAARRATAHARAHAAVHSRHPHLVITAAVGALLGVAIAVGATVPPAAAAEDRDAVASLVASTTAPVDPQPTGTAALIMPLTELHSGVTDAVAAAEVAAAEAEALTGEVAASGLVVEASATTIEPGALPELIRVLTEPEDLPVVRLIALDTRLAEETAQVTAETVALRTALTAAQDKRAAELAAAQAAAEALAKANTVEGAQATAKDMAASRYGWGADQFSCLTKLWHKESGWNYQAYNDSSGATGIPQSLPGSKMASAGSDWKTNATTQISWGLSYIDRTYGSPCSAWSHSQSTDWY